MVTQLTKYMCTENSLVKPKKNRNLKYEISVHTFVFI